VATDQPADGTPRGRRRVLGHRPERLPRTVGVAATLGVVGGLATVAFVRALEWAQDRLWTSLPDALDVSPDSSGFIVAVVMAGALLLGLGRRALGEYPVSLEQALEDHQRDGEFDRRHIGQAAVLSLVSLGFGAALGPEAALMAILGGICSWVARVIDADTAEGTDIAYVGIGGAMGALFGTAGAAALTLDPRGSDPEDARTGRLWRLLPALAAAWAGLWIYRWLGTSTHYFDLGLPDYSFRLGDLGWVVLVGLVAAAGGLAFLVVGRLADRVLAPLASHKVLTTMVGGAVLAALACWSSLVLFSGHEGVDTLVASYGDDSVRILVLIAAAKLAAAAVLLGAGWKGGRFFPAMFAGAAIGLAMSQALPGVAEVPAMAAGMTGIVGALITRPLPTVMLMVLFFPPAAWPAVVVAAVLGCLLGRRVGPRLPAR
jgi:H+/Cl- antiporter ClcA